MGGKAGSAQRRDFAQGEPTPLLCEETFARFCKSSSVKDVHEAVLLRLVEGDMRLLRIASARARKDSGAVAQEADALACASEALGFFQAAGLARQLQAACLCGNHASTYGLIGQLSEVFQHSGSVLEALLQRGTATKT
jgi:HPt (histidine-containing phosphotransfer) domain-containing protein